MLSFSKGFVFLSLSFSSELEWTAVNSVMLPFYFIRTDSEKAIFTHLWWSGFNHLSPNVKPAEKNPPKPSLCKTRNAPPGSWNCSLEVIYPSDYYSEYQLILQNLFQSHVFPIADFSHELAPRGSIEEKQSKELPVFPNPRASWCPGSAGSASTLGATEPQGNRDTDCNSEHRRRMGKPFDAFHIAAIWMELLHKVQPLPCVHFPLPAVQGSSLPHSQAGAKQIQGNQPAFATLGGF